MRRYNGRQTGNITTLLNIASDQKVPELWRARLLWKGALWKTIATGDLYDFDPLLRTRWMSDFRAELNMLFAVAANEKFLETGDPKKGLFVVCDDRFCISDANERDDVDSGSGADDESERNPAGRRIVPEESRLAFLKEKMTEEIRYADQILDGNINNMPNLAEACWKRLFSLGSVKRWVKHKEPETFRIVLEALEGEISDELESLAGAFGENMKEIRQGFGFSSLEARIFAFVLIAQVDRELQEVLKPLDYSKTGFDLAIEVMSVALNESFADVKAVFEPDSTLMRSGLIAVNGADDSSCFHELFELLDYQRFKGIVSTRMSLEKLIESTVREAPAAKLSLEDYPHLPMAKRVLVPYLERALKDRSRGVNILLYGLPGTGKTELTRTAAKALSAKLFEVATLKGNESRLQRWKTASAFLDGAENTILAIDEAEDVFNDPGKMETVVFVDTNGPSRTNKGEINHLLETNPVPTFWITNAIHAIDPAMVRRFDLVMEVPLPDIAQRRKIVSSMFEDRLSAQTIERLVQTERLAPAVLSTASRVAEKAGLGEGRIGEVDVVDMIDNTLAAQRFGCVPKDVVLLPDYYDPTFVNANLDLAALPQGLRKAGTARICLYGPPGTGKTAYAAWIARTLDRPLLRKTTAELTSCYVGETEKLIASVFCEAGRSGAVLLFDEADSLLRDRTLANHSWEATQVNEMLAQLEVFNGYFIATTNLLDSLDAASLRRFDLKAKFDFLKTEQALDLAEKTLASFGLSLDADARAILSAWRTLTPGDFAAVSRQSCFRPIASAADFVGRLGEELSVKGGKTAAKIGFC